MHILRLFTLTLCLMGTCVTLLAQNNGSRTRMMPPRGEMMPPPGGGMGGMIPMSGNINQFEVNFATEVPQEKDIIIKDKRDSLYSYFVENVKFGKTIKLVYSNNDVQITGLPENVQVEKDGAYLTIISDTVEPLAFELSGRTENGSLSFKTDAPLKLLFNNIVLKSQRGEAILVEGKSPVYAILAEGSVNELSDCRNPEMPPMMMGGFPPMGREPMDREGREFPEFNGERPEMGAMPDFRPGEMPFPEFGGEGNPEDYHEQYGIRMKKPRMKEKIKLDGTFVCAGSMTISGKGCLQVQSNNKVGIKSKASLMFRPGNLITVRALSGKGVNAKNELYIYGGALNVDCSSSADKALTCGRNMYIKGGHVVVKAGGGETSEGVESKFLMQIDGGKLEVAAQDDAINAQGDLVVNGGVVRAFSATNDAVDSNCNIVINGGEVFASGTGMPEGGLDSNDEAGYRLFINGGIVTAIGGRHSMPEKQSRQPSIQWRPNDYTVGKVYSISDVCFYHSTRDYQRGGATILFSSPNLQKGKSYSLCIDGEEAERIESLETPYSNVGNAGRGFPF